MPLVRFKIRNELSLGGPELNRSAAVENEEPKAILGAVEVAGLVGILRQLGDLAEFSAEVFNGIQEEVTVTASRCHKLSSRVRRIESALTPLEKAVLSQTSHIHFAYTAGCEWHPRIRNGHNHFVQSELPLCVMETYEQCRDPPPLHLLDRFDIGGPGSCLRRYSDPTFFRKDVSNPSKADDVKVQRDQAHRKRKKKRLPQRNVCRSRAVSTSDETNGTHLSSLTNDKQAPSETTSTVDMPHSSNLQDLSDIVDQSHLEGQSDVQEQSEAQVQSDFIETSKARDSITGSGYIEYVINQTPVNKPEVKLLEGFLSRSLQPADSLGSAVPEGCIEVVDDNILYSPSEDLPVPCASIVNDEKKEILESRVEKSSKDEKVLEIQESKFGPGTPDRVRQNQRDFDRTYILFDEVDIVGDKQSRSQGNIIDGTLGVENEGENKSESEADEFVDARNTIESESESELDGVPKPKLEHYFGDISTYCSEDSNSDNNDGSEDIPYEQMAQDSRHDDSIDESCSGFYLPEDENVSCFLSDPVCGKTLCHDESFQKPREFFAMVPPLLADEAFPDETVLQEPVTSLPLLAGDCADEKISSEEPVVVCPSLEDAIPADKILPEEQLVNYSFFTEIVPQEKILPEEQLANYSFFTEIVPQEKILPEESVAKYPSLSEVFPNKMLSENPLPKSPSLAEAVPNNMMTPAEEPDAAHPSFPKAVVQDENNSPDVLDSKSLTVPEAISPERNTLEEFVGISTCLAESISDERSLTEEPASTCPSLTKAMPIENILQEKSDDVTHSSCAKAAPEEKISAEVLDSTNLSAAEAVPQEPISLYEVVDIDQCLAEAVPDERFLPEKPVVTCLSLKRVADIEKVLPEEPLETYPSLAELPEERISDEDADDATHPSFSEAVSDKNNSPEVLDSTYLSVAEAVPREPISLDEVVGIDQCLAEAVPDERFLPEGPVTTCSSLTKAVAIQNVLPELLETYPSLAEFSEEKISHEEADTHPCLSEAVSNENILPEVLDSTNLSQKDAVPDERFLPEETVTTCPSLTNAVALEKVLPEELLEKYPFLAKLPEENILHEEDDTHPSSSEAVNDEKVIPEVLDSTTLSLEEAVTQEQAVSDERGLPEEAVITCMSLTKVVPIGQILPEEPLEACASLEKLPKEMIAQEISDDATHPSCAKDVSDEKVSPENLASTNLLAEAIPQEKISPEEFVGIDLCLAEVVPDKRVLPEEPVTTCPSLKKADPIEKILPEEPLEVYPFWEEFPEEKISQEEEPDDDATHPPNSEAVSEEKISPLEGPEPDDAIYPSLEGSVPQEKTSHEELVGMNPFLELAGPEERSFPNELGVTYQSKEKNLPEEPLPAYPSFAEVLPDEKISIEEPDATSPPSAEAVFDEKISGLEAPGSTTEAGPHNKTFPEEPVATNRSWAEEDFDEKVSGSEAPGSTTEAGPHNKTFPEEPVATDLSLAEAVFDAKIPGSEAPGSIREAGAHNKTFPEDPVTTDLSLAEEVFDEKVSGSEAPGSLREAGPHNKTFPEESVTTDLFLAEEVFDEKVSDNRSSWFHNKTFLEEPVATHLSLAEPVPDDNILPKEPAAASYLALAESIPDQQVFLDDAAFLSFAEAIFDQKFSPEVPDSTYPSLTVPEMPVCPPSLVTDLPDKHTLVNEGKVYDEPYTASDVSRNQKSGGTVTISPDTREIPSNGTSVEAVSIWSNGGLLGLAPSKPPVFAAEPISVSEYIQSEINKANDLPPRKQESSSRSIEDTEKSSLSLVVSDPTSQQRSNVLSRTNGSHSQLQSTATSFKVFGLSHRLLMAGFRGNSSTTCKFEALPSTSSDTLGGSRSEEQMDYESSLFGSPSSSPPVEHMKISFKTKDVTSVSKLKLRIPSQPKHNGENADMFPTFQLVPEANYSDDDDNNSDIFCQSSSPCVSDNCLSDSELWESDESPRKFVSSLDQVGESSRHGEMGSLSGSFLDLPCFDSVDHQSTSSRLEQEQDQDYKPSVSEIIRDWPPNQPKASPSNEANANAVLKKTQNQSVGPYATTNDDGER